MLRSYDLRAMLGRAPLALGLAAVLAAPARAGADDASADAAAPMLTVTGAMPGITARQRAVPPQLSPGDRASYRQIFLDIDTGRYPRAEATLAAMGDGLLTGAARGQLILARGSGRLDRAALCSWLSANADLPQAPRIAALAERLPALDAAPLPLLPVQRPLRQVSYRPAASLGDAAMPADGVTATALKQLLATERNAEAEVRLTSATLSPGVRTEWAQRIAWSYYGQNDNAAAQRLGTLAAGGSGQWAALGAWVAGLAQWRTGDFAGAAAAFDRVATKLPSDDVAGAAAYWASRAHLASGRADLVAARLEIAARSANSFYGLIARRALGLAPVQDWAEPDFITADWNYLKNIAGARRAAALIEIGQIGIADRELRYLAVTAPDASFPALLRLAARLNLPATQYALAVRPPVGVEAPLSARYPAPDWNPARGWRVDRGLVFAHALQESTFVTTATSRTGAKGLMQLMPATARQLAAEMNATQLAASSATTLGANSSTAPINPSTSLTDPAFNIEVGQTYLEALRDMSYTGGLLPKVVAAYNAGPGSVQRWNASLDDRGDPLLFIESIPFKETRHYVKTVLRNYWMYQLRDGVPTTAIDALATGQWPKFPGMPGARMVRLSAHPVQAAPPGVAPLQPILDLENDTTVTAGK